MEQKNRSNGQRRVLRFTYSPRIMHCSHPMSLDTEDVNQGLVCALVNKQGLI